jgi:hypothetical protein
MAEKEPMEIYDGETVKLTDVSDGGSSQPVGEYVCRLARIDPTKSKNGEPMVNAWFDILEGDHEGEEIRFFFWLGARKDRKTGRVFAPGIAEIRAACASIGKPLAPDMDFPRDATKAAKLFGTPFYGTRVKIRVLNDVRKDKETGEEVKGTRPKIMGLASGATPAAVAAGNTASPLAGIV